MGIIYKNGTYYGGSGNGEAKAGFTPVGTIISVMGNTAPANYLACNGQVVNIADYPILANYFEAQFGSKNHFGGDGTTTFGIPDLRGEFLRGTGTNGHANQGNGANVGVHQNGTEIPSIMSYVDASNQGVLTANVPNDNARKSYLVTNFDVNKTAGTGERYYYNTDAKTIIHQTGLSYETTTSYTTRPTNTSVLYCIATNNIYMDPKNNYSTEEKIVGTWIDGKPLYQKTLNIDSLSTGTNSIAHNIANLKKAFVVSGYFVYGDGTVSISLPYMDESSGSNSFISVGSINKTNLVIYVGSNYGAFNSSTMQACVTIQYTKTTD